MDRSPRRRHKPLIEPLEHRLLLTASELVRNGSFEGPTPSDNWTFGGDFHADSTFPNPHSGLGYAYVADPTTGASLDHANGTMYQTVTVPATPTASQLTLNFWTYITTSEITTTTQFDKLHVQIMNSAGTTQLADVVTLGNLDKTTGYVQHSYSLPLSLAGQTVRVLFTGTTDGLKPTTFRVDDVGFSYAPLPTTQRVVGYMPGATDVSQIDFGLLTWANYSNMTVNSDGSLNGVSNSSLASVVSAAHAKGAGVSISVIQPGPDYDALKLIAADPTARTNFANNILGYIQSHNLDGVDIDYEPPATGVNQANYALMIDSLYAALHPFGYAITTASNPITHEVPVAAANELDWINVMCYDFYYDDVAPLQITLSSMNNWATYGVPKSKLVMGVPFYGKYGTSWSDSHAKSYGDSSLFSSTGHILSNYQSLHGTYPPSDVDSYVDQNGNTTYFNNIDTMQAKMAFVRDNGFGGAMIWALLYDHWDASNHYDQYSMLPVVSSMVRTPSWLTPASASTYDLYNQTFELNSGSVTLSGDSSLANPGLTLTLDDGTTASFGATQRLANLNLTGTAKLDMKNAKVVLDYTSSSPIGSLTGTTYSGVLGEVQSGRNGGSWNGAGIFTSQSAAKTGKPLTTIGVAEASDALGITGGATKVWNGYTVDSSTLLIRYTIAGDANLDGVITGDDYFAIDSRLGKRGVSYAQGDFNYDGKINADDYFIIDSNYSHGQAAVASLMPGSNFALARPPQKQNNEEQPTPTASTYQQLIGSLDHTTDTFDLV